MGQCISWDRQKSIWALRILSEVFLCTGIVACVAAFTIEVIIDQSLSHMHIQHKKVNTRNKRVWSFNMKRLTKWNSPQNIRQ